MDPFSAVLGLVGTGISTYASFNNGKQQQGVANEQLALQRRALMQQQGMAQQQFALGQSQLQRELAQEEYIRGINAQNRNLLFQEYQTRLNSQLERRGQAQRERGYVLDRQIKSDRDAASRQAFQLEAYLKNKDIASDEREYAKGLLEEQKRIASGERDDDMRRYYEERRMAVDERNFAIQQMQRSQDIARRERQDDASIRDSVLNRAVNLQGTMDATLRSLGTAPEVPRATREDIANEVALRENTAMSDVDRAVSRVASVNEASLIKAGMDNSSLAHERRAEIAARSGLEYAKARDAARDSAIKYVSGVQNELMEGYGADMQRRWQVLTEAGNVGSAGLNIMTNLKPLRSENDYRAPVQVGTGVYARNTRSANSYQAPVQLGTALYDRFNGGTSLGDFLGPATIAGMFDINAGTATAAPANWTVSSPSTYFGAAQNGMNTAASAFGTNAQRAQVSANMNEAGMYKGLAEGLQSVGGMLNRWYNQKPAEGPIGFTNSNEQYGPFNFGGDWTTANTRNDGYMYSNVPMPPMRPDSFYSILTGYNDGEYYA